MRDDFIDEDKIYNRYTTQRFLRRILKAKPDSDEALRNLHTLIAQKKIDYAPNTMGFLGKDINDLLKAEEINERRVRKKQVKDVLKKLNELLNGQAQLKKNVAKLSKEVEEIKRLQVKSEPWEHAKKG